MHPPDPSSARRESLAAAADFADRILPRLLTGLCRRAGMAGPAVDDVVDEARQDVFLDAIEHADQVAELSPDARTQRWMAIASRSRYRLAVRHSRRRSDAEDVDVWLPGLLAETPWPDLPSSLADLADPLRQLVRHARRLQNGRLATVPTARAAGMSPRAIRELWGETARRLGYGPEHEHFWVRRLAEALTAIAAARLVADGRIRVWNAAARRRPDPAGDARRVARIRRMLEVRPMPATARRVLARITARDSRPHAMPPRSLLGMAETLVRDDPAVALWRFEAAIADGDWRDAARALRIAHAAGADRLRVALARCRLLECRGRPAAAARLLDATLRHAPRDPRLTASREALGATPRERIARRHAPSSRSATSNRAAS